MRIGGTAINLGPRARELHVARSVRCLAGSATIEMAGLRREVARPTGFERGKPQISVSRSRELTSRARQRPAVRKIEARTAGWIVLLDPFLARARAISIHSTAHFGRHGGRDKTARHWAVLMGGAMLWRSSGRRLSRRETGMGGRDEPR